MSNQKFVMREIICNTVSSKLSPRSFVQFRAPALQKFSIVMKTWFESFNSIYLKIMRFKSICDGMASASPKMEQDESACNVDGLFRSNDTNTNNAPACSSSTAIASTVSRTGSSITIRSFATTENDSLAIGFVTDTTDNDSSYYANTTIDTGSKLRAVLIHSISESAIVLRCEPNDPNNISGSTSEKVLLQAVNDGLYIVDQFNISSEQLLWYDQNMPMKNKDGVPIKMVYIPLMGRLHPKDTIIRLAHEMCRAINNMPGNNTTISVDLENFFWLPDGAVWSDVIGVDAAFTTLKLIFREPNPGYYRKNRIKINDFFHIGSFENDLAHICFLRPPIDAIDT